MPKSSKMGGRYIDEPVMSDLTLLMSVENLINIAMGPPGKNTINYKMLQIVLQILARNMRLLNKKVEVNIPDDGSEQTQEKLTEYLASTARERAKRAAKSKSMKETEDFVEKENVVRSKLEVQYKSQNLESKEQSTAEKAEAKKAAEKAAAEEKRNMEKMTPEEKKKYLEQKEREEKKILKMSPSEKEKYLKEKEELSRMSPKEEEKYLKEKKESEMAKMTPEEKERFLIEKERENREMEKITLEEKNKYLEEEEKDLQGMTPKEKEEYFKEKVDRKTANMSPEQKEEFLKEKEERKIAKMTSEEKEIYFKEKGREKNESEKITPEEKIKYLKEKEERVMANMTPKEKEKYLEEKDKEEKELQKMTPQEKEQYFKEKEESDMKKITSKEKEKYLKQKEKEEREMALMSPKEKEKYLKEKVIRVMANMTPKEKVNNLKEKEEKDIEKMSSKEKTQYFQEKDKEQKALDKVTRKENKEYIKEKQVVERFLGQKRERTASGTSIALAGPRRRGSGIDIVTQSEFRLLEDVVKDLKKKAGPLPMPTLPDSKKLKADLAEGRASLTDTMEAMKVSARMQATEQAVGRMAKMLTQLAAAGVLPEEFAQNLKEVQAGMAISTEADQAVRGVGRSAAVGPLAIKESHASTFPSGRASIASRAYHGPVWQDQMDDFLLMMKDDLIAKIQTMMQRAIITADAASGTAKAVVDNFDAVMKMNNKINALYSLSTDCANQLTGFDSGFTMQMQSFNEQIMILKDDLKVSLAQLTSANRHPESPVVMDLKECYRNVATDLDQALTVHQNQAENQRQLGDELHSLMELVEMLQEQKADRDEMLDGLRDKADDSKLDGLVTMKRFESIRMDIDIKLRACYTKFSKQKAVLMAALKDLLAAQNSKAEVTDLLIMKENVKDDMLSIHDALDELAIQLAQPKAAILMRLLCKEGQSAPCEVEALLVPRDPTRYQPHHRLPALRPLSSRERCVPEWHSESPINIREHICKRRAGGSHTLASTGTPREASPPPPPSAPSRRYTACGTDEKPYKMAEYLLPCVECNEQTPTKQRVQYKDIPLASRDGGGDDIKLTTKISGRICDCLPVIRI